MKKINIMVVEDDGAAALDIKARLESLGYAAPAIVSSSGEVLSKVVETRPDLVLVDVALRGEMDGVETAGKIQEIFGIPVIYITASADEDTFERAKITGPFGYILKPFNDRELHLSIEIALDRHDMDRKLKGGEKGSQDDEMPRVRKKESIAGLAGDIAHDFNNLLTAILGNLSFAKMFLSREDRVYEQLISAENASLRAKDLTSQLLALARGCEPVRPAAFPSQTAVGAEKVKKEKPAEGKGRILVMDDEEIVRLVSGNMLHHIGYEVEFAENGEEALALYADGKSSRRPFDAVILDLTIRGGMGGGETIKRLLDIDPAVKAVVSSGYTHDPMMTDFRRYGFCGVLPKPYKIEELDEAMHAAVRKT